MKYLLLLLLSCGWLMSGQAQAAKCMLVMSYHQGYAWNDGVQKGVESVLKGKCELKIFYMDAKRHKSPGHARAMAKKAKELIDEFRPDVLIASDDHASRYLVTEYYRDAELPVVFCAVNWDVSKYGYPYQNVTGMIEVAPIQPLLEVTRKVLGEIKRIAYLGADTLSEKKNLKRVTDVMHKQGVTVDAYLVTDIASWKKMFIQAQAADLIMLGSNAGIENWQAPEMVDFVKRHAKKMTVTNHSWMTPYSMYAMTKIAEEQGEWAAEAALAIIKGLAPTKIPIRVNRKWQTYVNSPLLQKAGIDLKIKSFTNYIEVNGRSDID